MFFLIEFEMVELMLYMKMGWYLVEFFCDVIIGIYLGFIDGWNNSKILNY